MKAILSVLLLAGPLTWAQTAKEMGSLVVEGVPEIPAALADRLNQYQNTRSASFSGWFPDGKSMLISTRFAETAQLHVVEMPGGARKQITFFKEPIGGGSFSPNAKYKGFMFTKDVGGNEFRQLHWFDLTNGSYQMLSDGGRTQNSTPSWSNRGDQFIYVSTRRNLKDYDLYLSSMANPKDAKIILQQGGSWAPADWSPDDTKVIVRNYISANRSYGYVLDIATAKLEPINPSEEEIAYNGAVWSADGKGIFLINDQGSEFQTLKYYDIGTKKSTDITQSIPWDVDDMIINRSRSTIAFVTNENGISKMCQLNTATKKFSPITGVPTGLIGNMEFHPSRNEIAFSISTPQSPGDVYSIDLNSNKLTRWTFSEVGGLDPATFPQAELIEYETFDQVNGKPRKIPAFIFKPKNATGKVPVVINIHGGPEGQSRPAFGSFTTFLVNELGVALILPNVRGSTGYGKTYLKLDNGMKREESVKDIGALLDWIARQPNLDASRVCVWGGSYGGYMTLASMTHFNDRLRCGVDVVGISNFVTFLKNTEDYRKDLRRVEYGDERDPDMNKFLESISPANHVSKISKPLMIVQGANDPRVPMSESEQMKKKLRDQGNEVWYILGKDEGHGFRKKPNVDYYQQAVVMFLQRYLLN